MAPGSPRGRGKAPQLPALSPVLLSTQGLFHMAWGLTGVFVRSGPGLGSLPSSFSFHFPSFYPLPALRVSDMGTRKPRSRPSTRNSC